MVAATARRGLRLRIRTRGAGRRDCVRGMVAVRNVAVSCGAFSLEEADVAQRVEVRLSDDLTGADIPPGKGETVGFVLDGKAYEIDLTAKNAAALRKALRPVRRGRPIDQGFRAAHDPDQGRCGHAHGQGRCGRAHGQGVGSRQRLPGARPWPRAERDPGRIRGRELTGHRPATDRCRNGGGTASHRDPVKEHRSHARDHGALYAAVHSMSVRRSASTCQLGRVTRRQSRTVDRVAGECCRPGRGV